MRDTVRLDGYFPALQYFQVIPITDRLLRFDISIKAVCRAAVADGHKEHRREPKKRNKGSAAWCIERYPSSKDSGTARSGKLFGKSRPCRNVSASITRQLLPCSQRR
jgi:hypothetical protein